MDLDLAALSSAAATTLVTLMTTDGWDGVKSAFVALWHRRDPDHAGLVDADLTALRSEVVSARQAGDEEAVAGLVGEWQSRLRRLAASDEVVREELRRLVEELRPLRARADLDGPVVMRAMRCPTVPGQGNPIGFSWKGTGSRATRQNLYSGVQGAGRQASDR